MATTAPRQFNSKSPTIRRILREAHELATSPSPDYHASPLETDLFEWHFTLRGPPNSPFEEGIYHGRISLPPTYPYRPPSFRFLTPSGRFETNREICLSISGHHEETWQPAWGVRTALVALRSFMETDAKGQLGGLEAGEEVRRRLAKESRTWRCGVCGGGKTNGEILEEWEEKVRELEKEGKGAVKEEKVPEELRLAWRDELVGGKKGGDKDGESDGESARLAEGFVQTAPAEKETTAIAAQPATGGPPRAQTTSSSTAPVTTQPETRPLPVQTQPQPQQQLAMQQPRADEDNVTLWLDRLIVAVAVLLVAVILKVLLG
ncbi:ubiquitin conjugating enzyme-like protein [Thermochaetoides thermophila DSM 1495]|uniref:Ubiquitin conjugating enzyme-like protein n=1 Tax=Chaetomium thermophilum (strain DSM 1495 / CBS 144.50 / IMI 039719) TaxID=759272 RepID=G0SGF6_CHATD|nr:ubiquitin conjugating enzyme-like protein [Thermochaetoides thermophila DSM 1495]EGS17295.1 ubiquitin conjugating enzyme-like protein [Thermochaetoides thermophila DSM 1495]